jgi:hypothetical protein
LSGRVVTLGQQLLRDGSAIAIAGEEVPVTHAASEVAP